MGTGKTSWAIQYMKENPDMLFLYVTPFLTEVERILQAMGNGFYTPFNFGDGKIGNVKELMEEKKSIVATHALFKQFDCICEQLIQDGEYVLILDEVLDVFEPLNLSTDDSRILLDSGCITIDERARVHWQKDKEKYQTRYNEVKQLAQQGNLVQAPTGTLIWEYPVSIFRVFTEVYILTYLFEGCLMHQYFSLYEIEHEKKSITKTEEAGYQVVEFSKPDTAVYAPLIHFHIDRMSRNITPKKALQRIQDSHAQPSNALSISWFQNDKNRRYIEQLKKNLSNYFTNIHKKEKSETYLWTTVKDKQNQLKGAGYTKRFLAFSSRATNEYSHTAVLAHCINIFLSPVILGYLNARGVEMRTEEQEKYALGMLIQWIWRSRIRNGEPIWLYIPCERMRFLLQEWLGLAKR